MKNRRENIKKTRINKEKEIETNAGAESEELKSKE